MGWLSVAEWEGSVQFTAAQVPHKNYFFFLISIEYKDEMRQQ